MNDLLDSSFRGFSCPFEPFTEELGVMIAAEYACGISRVFLDRHRDIVERNSRGLCETLEPWLAGTEISGAGWDLCFGDAYRAIHTEPTGHHTSIAAAMATHLGARGLPGKWQADLPESVRLRWGGLLLPPSAAISVETDGRTASIVTETEGARAELHLTKNDGEWGGDAERIQMVTRYGLRLSVLSREALVLRDFDDLVAKALPTIDSRMIDVFNRAIEIIEGRTPMYIPWVRRALHNVFILYPRNDTIESGSVEHYLGLVHMSAHANPLPIAELLVHEAAHQHMNLLTKIGPVDDGSDGNTYYSPPVDKQRKLSLIMAAYHAFANVLLFYRLCRQNGIAEQKECNRQESILRPWLDQLEAPLRDNPALTEIGRALWEPLRSQLQTIE